MAQIPALSRDRLSALVEDARPAIVDVWGPQCQPCLALAPTYEQLADTFGDRARFFKLEAPANRMACVDLKVIALPTFLAFRDGQEVARLSGSIGDRELSEWVGQFIDSEGGDEHQLD